MTGQICDQRPSSERGARRKAMASVRVRCLAATAMMVWLGACASTGPVSYQTILGPAEAEAPAINNLSGNYLAAQEATRERKSSVAAAYYQKALAEDPGNVTLTDRAFVFELSAGHPDRAVDLARTIMTTRKDNTLAGLTIALNEINHNRSARAREELAALGGGIYSRLVIDLVTAWTYAADKRFDEAERTLSTLEALGSEGLFRAFHLGLMQDVHGSPDKAEIFYSKAAELSGNGSTRIIDAYGRLLEREGKRDEAVVLYEAFLKIHPEHPLITVSLARAREGKQTPPKIMTRTRQGAAEVLHGVASLMAVGRNTRLPILYLQLARWCDPDLAEANLLLGDLYWQDDQYEKSARALAEIPMDHPYAPSAGVQIALNLERMGRPQDAERILRHSIAEHPRDISATVALGDILRASGKFEQAVGAYDRAFEIVGDDNASWFLYYSRGASLELAGFWTEAERDLLAALERAPTQPLILNHLGYSWVDRGVNLERGMELIQKAVELSPGNGLIVDSLGWAYYRIGDFDTAIEHLERALELEPEDPTLHEHLGDAYWQVGRYREARFQWNHALVRNPPSREQKEALEKKLKEGLARPAGS